MGMCHCSFVRAELHVSCKFVRATLGEGSFCCPLRGLDSQLSHRKLQNLPGRRSCRLSATQVRRNSMMAPVEQCCLCALGIDQTKPVEQCYLWSVGPPYICIYSTLCNSVGSLLAGLRPDFLLVCGNGFRIGLPN